jgi:hypothetical protein
MQVGNFLNDAIFSLLAIGGIHFLIRQVWLHWRFYR